MNAPGSRSPRVRFVGELRFDQIKVIRGAVHQRIPIGGTVRRIPLLMNDSRPQFVCALLALLALGLGGCAGTPPPEKEPQDRLTVGRVQGEIKVGMSATAVVEVLGSPNIITTDEMRRESWVYDKISTEHTEASRSSYGTLILFGGNQNDSRTTTRQRTLTVIIKFDEQKLVRDFAYNYTQF